METCILLSVHDGQVEIYIRHATHPYGETSATISPHKRKNRSLIKSRKAMITADFMCPDLASGRIRYPPICSFCQLLPAGGSNRGF